MNRGTLFGGALLGLLALALFCGGCGNNRPHVRETLVQRQRQYEDDALAQRELVRRTVLARLEVKAARAAAAGVSPAEPIDFDMLLLSSGGQFGAFGVGVLQGWSACSMLQRPEFDFVTGVSTGAMIAPFAIVGSETSIHRIEQLYQEVDDRFAVLRDVLFFLPWRESFYDNTKLRRRLETEVNLDLLSRVARADENHRLLLIGTTDLDLGRMRMWDMGDAARQAVQTGNPRRVHDIMLASAAIPAAFPPVLIDGALHVDGGTTQQAFVGMDRDEIVSMAREFASRVPGRSPPRLRLWVIVNGKIDQDAAFVRNTWVPLAGRSVGTLMSYSMRTTLRHLEFGSELISRDLGVPLEFRYIAVPQAFETPVSDSLFDRELMGRLLELGRVMGADASSWRTTVGPAEFPNAESTYAPVPLKPATKTPPDVPVVPPGVPVHKK